MLFRLAGLVAAVLFAYATVVQVNDPDPVQWMVLYGATSVFSALSALGRPPRLAMLTLALSAAALSAYSATLPSAGNPMAGFPSWEPLQEETVRETLGLALVALWMGVLWAWSGARRDAAAAQ